MYAKHMSGNSVNLAYVCSEGPRVGHTVSLYCETIPKVDLRPGWSGGFTVTIDKYMYLRPPHISFLELLKSKFCLSYLLAE